MPIPFKHLSALLLASLLSSAAFGQTSCTKLSPDCVAVGEWDLSVSLGYGERSNPIAGQSAIPLVVIPHISYYGRKFFLDNLEIGYTLHESESHVVNFIATPGYDRVFFFRDDLQNYFVNGVGGATVTPGPELERAIAAPRHTTYLTGLEWLYNTRNLSTQFDALYEATGRHKGVEVRGAVAASLLQSDNSLVLSGGFTWKSKEVVDYYYGLDPLYRPAHSLNPFIKLGYSRQLSQRWTVNAFAHYEHLGDAIADSPIVTDDGVLTVFAGVIFKLF